MATEAKRVEAVRQILIQLYMLIDAGIPAARITRIEREAIFFLYEAEGGKFPVSRPHSLAARALRQAGGGRIPQSEVTYDHAVPLATLRPLLRTAVSSLEAFTDFLKRYVQGVVITRDEDKLLNDAGWRSAMPGDKGPDDLMARYERAGIVFGPEDEAQLRRNSN